VLRRGFFRIAGRIPGYAHLPIGLAAEGAQVKRALLTFAPALAVAMNVLLFYFYVGQYSAGAF
jgi:hypothetical protein